MIYKNKKFVIPAVIIVAIVGLWMFFGGEKAPEYETIITKRSDLIQEVSVTGKVKPAQAVDLQFESSGRVASINYKVGDRVVSGGIIASLENQELQAAVTSAKADLERTVRNFNSLNDPSVSSSLRVELQNAKENLVQVSIKAEGDLATKYSNIFNVMREAMTQIDSSSATLEYMRKTYLQSGYFDPQIRQYQTEVSSDVSGVRATLPQIDQSSSTITPTLYSQIELASQKLMDACESLRAAYTFLQLQIQDNLNLISSSTDRASINTEAATLSSDLSAISSSFQGLQDQKILNDKNISDAEAKLATVEASFPTPEDILQKESALLSAQAQLRKTLIIAPFTGIIGKLDIERGQTVSSSIIAVSFISAANYQIEANITEIDISKIKVGDTAVLTLDAYGAQTIFSANVSVIDTAATVVDGVTTYKTILDFNGNVDPGIRPNMTANIDIQTAKKENVISIPQRAVISRNGDKIVRIFAGENMKPEERLVQLGMSGKDGYVEIISGLVEGEVIITFINE